LFDTIKTQLPNVKIIAEDLGDLRPEVLMLRDHYQLPGMKIMQFEFPIYPNQSGQLPPPKESKLPTHAIAYTGTHDNQTTMGWYQKLLTMSQQRLAEFLKAYQGTISEKLVQYTLQAKPNQAILPMQDLLSMNDDARMNVPGTIGSPNWEWKLKDFTEFETLIPKFQQWLTTSQRI
jgi:4-alpha-glucanotransferase